VRSLFWKLAKVEEKDNDDDDDDDEEEEEEVRTSRKNNGRRPPVAGLPREDLRGGARGETARSSYVERLTRIARGGTHGRNLF